MKKSNLAVPLLLIILLGISCKRKILNQMDDELTLSKKSNSSNKMRLDGYYYQKGTGPNGSIVFGSIYFFYSNGAILYGAGFDSTEIIQKENEFSNGTFYDYAKADKTSWGLYDIHENEIKFERWYPSSVLKAYIRAGNIENDTTFLITESYRNKKNKKTEISVEYEKYYFKRLPLKPDSTNPFTK